MTTLTRAADWTDAQAKGTAASIQDSLRKYPDGTEAEQARAKLSSLSAYKVQLGKVRAQKQAQKEQETLRSKYGNVLHAPIIEAIC